MHKTPKRGNTPVARVIDRLWKRERELSGEEFDLTELARRTDMNQPTLYRLYRGEISDPKPKTVKPFLDYFEISFEQLISESVESKEPDQASARAKALAKRFDALPARAKQVVYDLVELLENQDKPQTAKVIRLPHK